MKRSRGVTSKYVCFFEITCTCTPILSIFSIIDVGNVGFHNIGRTSTVAGGDYWF